MVEITPFKLSRTYASGWSAGRTCSAGSDAEVEEEAERLNPCQLPEERSRWHEGFIAGALRGFTKSVKKRPQQFNSGEQNGKESKTQRS